MKHIHNRIKIAVLSVDLKECNAQKRNPLTEGYKHGMGGARIPIHDSTKSNKNSNIQKLGRHGLMVLSCNPTLVVRSIQFGEN